MFTLTRKSGPALRRFASEGQNVPARCVISATCLAWLTFARSSRICTYAWDLSVDWEGSGKRSRKAFLGQSEWARTMLEVMNIGFTVMHIPAASVAVRGGMRPLPVYRKRPIHPSAFGLAMDPHSGMGHTPTICSQLLRRGSVYQSTPSLASVPVNCFIYDYT